jgi:serine/threonine protein phosphatase 1
MRSDSQAIPLKILPLNRSGRDFVVGDLHGRLDLLKKGLALVNFDVSRDRLLSVGDLIDRGPDSPGCLDLLGEPWFFAAMGNHEAMLLSYAEGWWFSGHRASDFVYNGGGWWLAQTPERQAVWLEHVRRMPLCLQVGRNPSYYVLHAEVWPDTQRLTPELITSNTARVIWGRTGAWQVSRHLTDVLDTAGEIQDGELLVAKAYDDEPLQLTGHSVFPTPALRGHQVYLDCGAYMSGENDYNALAMAEVSKLQKGLAMGETDLAKLGILLVKADIAS